MGETKPTESMEQGWEEEFDNVMSHFSGDEINAGCPKSWDKESECECEYKEVKAFIHKVRQEAMGEGCIQAYKLFLEEIRNAKAKFPSRNEFELVVDVRDVEKLIYRVLKNDLPFPFLSFFTFSSFLNFRSYVSGMA
jgi:hypothetical protein